MKRAAAWLYRRWGQMFCFGLGGWMVIFSNSGEFSGTRTSLLGGGVFLLTGLALKGLSIWRERPPIY